MKTLTVLISGAPQGDNLRDLEIEPGTSAGDVLRALNLQGYLLSREGSAQAFAAEEPIYDVIRDGEKLRATPIAEVGAFVDWLAKVLVFLKILPSNFELQSGEKLTHWSKASVCVNKLRPARVRVRRPQVSNQGRLRVERDRRALHELRGWRRQGTTLVGAFRTPRGSFAGTISLENTSRPQFFILNPPEAVLKGKHGACFRKRSGGRWLIHFGIHSPNVDSGIVAVEKIIAQAV